MRTVTVFPAIAWLCVLLTLCASADAPAPCPAAPPFTVLEPSGECWVSPGDVLTVAVKGGGGYAVTFSLGSAFTAVPMRERSPGVYAASVLVRAGDVAAGGKVIFSAADKAGQVTTTASTGAVTILRELTVGEAAQRDTLLRTGPAEEFDRRWPLQPGVRLAVTGLRNEYYRVVLGEGQSAWAPRAAIVLCPPGTAPCRPSLTSVHARSSEKHAELELVLSEPAAFELREAGDLAGLDVVLYGTSLAVDNIVHPAKIEFIKLISPEQESAGKAVLHVLLDGRLSGFDARQSGKVLTVTLLRPRRALEGSTIILDPGHGGRDTGAVGAGGLAEKDVNLQVALRARELLAAKGATVILTREKDAEVSPVRERGSELSARVEAAARAEGTLYVSIHHNAMATAEEGRKAHGTDIYYWRAQSAPLARALAAPLAASVAEDRARFLRRSFQVIRQTAMPAVLVEINFLSNPAWEEKMRSDSYAADSAKGIVQGLEDYFNALK